MPPHETSYAGVDYISMTPFILVFFGTTISIQQPHRLHHDANRIERYVVKYEVKFYQRNRLIVSDDANNGAVVQTEQHFLRYPDVMMNLRLAVRYQCRTVLHQLWLQYITFNLVSVMGKVTKVFYRYEHQQKNSNHVHCIMALY